jgi:hypothetical protein
MHEQILQPDGNSLSTATQEYTMMLKRFLTIPLLVLLVLTMLCGCSKLTMKNYTKIKMGLGYSEVVAILGKPDSCTDALIVRSCVWGSEEKSITVNFMSDKAIIFTSKNIK